MDEHTPPDVTEWIQAIFSGLGEDPAHLPAFHRHMLHEIESWRQDGIDAFALRDSKTDPDDPDEPDSNTYGYVMLWGAKEFLSYYRKSLKNGHTDGYAEAYARERAEDGCEVRVSENAYRAIGSEDSPWGPGNPGYEDALHAARKRGKDEDFARRCAEELPDSEMCFEQAFSATEQHFKEMAAIQKKLVGKSDLYSEAFTHALARHTDSHDTARCYAECFEELVDAGRDRSEAEFLSTHYARELVKYDPDLLEDSPDEYLIKDLCLALAEAKLRFQNPSAGETRLPDLFIRVYQHRATSDGTKAWFDEIESLARSVLAGERSIDDIPSSPLMKFLEEEEERKEREKPPRFDLMSESEFRKFRSRNEDEHDSWLAEFQFREECRDMDLDPTDPDERERYLEILSETGEGLRGT
jgi:hypothetical protein